MASDEHNDRPEGQGDTGLPVPCVWLTLSMMDLSEKNKILQNWLFTNLVIVAPLIVPLDQVLGVDV